MKNYRNSLGINCVLANDSRTYFAKYSNILESPQDFCIIQIFQLRELNAKQREVATGNGIATILPKDIWTVIGMFSDGRDVANLSSTCKKLNDVFSNEAVIIVEYKPDLM